jgi:hypothetical protein
MAHVVNTDTRLGRRATMQLVWFAFLCVMLVALVANLGRSVVGPVGNLKHLSALGVLQAASDAVIQPVINVINHRYKPAELRRWLLIAGHLVALVVIGQLISGPWIVINGHRGKQRVLQELERLPERYWVLNDVRVPGPQEPSQIDHVLVSPHGLWCIDTKTHQGQVSGGEHDYQWTQVTRSSIGQRHTIEFYNPVRQNTTHCSILTDYLRSQKLDAPIRPMVVFATADLDLMTMTPVEKPETLVGRVLELDTEVVLDETRVQRIVESLTGLLAISPRRAYPAAAPDPYPAADPGSAPPDAPAPRPQSLSEQA